MGLNTLFYGLMNQKKFSQIDFSELKLVVSGGMALQKIVADRWYELTKTTIIEGYGLTEASPVIAINPVTVSSFSGSVGLPLPATEVAIRDANGDCLPLGQVGALWVRGPQVMKGYWQRDQETHEVIDSNGWLNTGDIARIDDRGMLYLVDRAKDIIIVSGFNVFPNEIERVLMSHPDVQEAAVVGVPCEATGEAVKAFIIPLKNGLLTEEIIAYCHQHLTHYKIPKYVEFKDDLPKSNVGKVLRRALREE